MLEDGLGAEFNKLVGRSTKTKCRLPGNEVWRERCILFKLFSQCNIIAILLEIINHAHTLTLKRSKVRTEKLFFCSEWMWKLWTYIILHSKTQRWVTIHKIQIDGYKMKLVWGQYLCQCNIVANWGGCIAEMYRLERWEVPDSQSQGLTAECWFSCSLAELNTASASLCVNLWSLLVSTLADSQFLWLTLLFCHFSFRYQLSRLTISHFLPCTTDCIVLYCSLFSAETKLLSSTVLL